MAGLDDELEFERSLGLKPPEEEDEEAFEASLWDSRPAAPEQGTSAGARLLDKLGAQEDAQQARKDELEAEYGGGLNQAGAAVQGGLRGISLGTSDAASAALTGSMLDEGPQLTPEARARIEAVNRTRAPEEQIALPEQRSAFRTGYEAAREYQDELREAHSGIALASELGGALLGGGAALGGRAGAGLVSRGLAATPAALAERAGAALTRRIAGQGAGLVRTTAAGAAGGALAGEIGNLALQASRMPAADIQDPAKAAEHMVSALGQGALLGGLAGGVLAGGGRLLRGGARAADEFGTTVQRGAAEATPLSSVEARIGALDDAEQGIRQEFHAAGEHPEIAREAAAEVVDNEASAILHEATSELEQRPLSAAQIPEPVRGKWQARAEQAQAAGGRFDEAVQAGTAALRQDYDEALRAMNQIDEYGGIAAKQRANRFNVGHPVDSAPIDDMLTGIEGEILQWQGGRSRAGLQSGGGLAALEGVKKSLKENGELIRGALSRGEVGEAYGLLDQGVKGFLGRARSATRAEPVRDLIERLYPRVQSFLEDESTWGELAQRQKLANPSWSNRIAASMDARVQPMTSISGERAANGWDNIRLANAGSLKNLLANAGDAGVSDVEEAFRTQLRSMARDATDRARAWGGKGLRDEATRVVGSVKRMEDVLDQAALIRRDKLAHEQSLKGSTIELVGQLAGSLGQNSVAAAISGAAAAKRKLTQILGAATTPESKAAIASVMPPRTALENTVSSVAESAAGRTARSAAALFQAAKAGTSAAVPAAPVASGVMMSEKRHQEAVREAQALANPGSPETQALLEHAAELEQQSPALADAYASLTLRRANYIASRIPPNPSAHIFAPGPVMDPVTDRKLRRSVGAAYNPDAAIERIAAMRGSPEDLDAVKTLYPSMFRDFQQRALEALSPGKLKLGLTTRLEISRALGIPFDPTMEPDQIAMLQQVARGPDQQKLAEAEKAQDEQEVAQNFKSFDANAVYAPRTDAILDQR